MERSALEELKKRLRRLRAERRISMTALERRAGLGHTTVSKAMNGSALPSEASLIALARALGAEAEPLLELRRRALPPAATSAETERGTGLGTAASIAADDDFEGRYREYVKRRYGQLSVVGLDLSRPEQASWPLDAAYLSLDLASSDDSFFVSSSDPAEVGPPGSELRVERAEHALAGRRRVLVRGLAGSGKTTLLQWLAIATADRKLPASLTHLRNCIPIVLPLRTLVRSRSGALPSPTEYLSSTGCPLHTAQPNGWADRLLANGRALVLIDGVDEVPKDQRSTTKSWLRELLAAYPDSCYVVTTRPSAVHEGWLAENDFAELSVRPMSARDVAVFVARWHTAAGVSDSEEARVHLTRLKEALTDAVRSQRDLARLTTTPLLCALVCALHRERRGHLPQGRMELYAAALSMLLTRRDRERDIETPEGISLTEHQSIQLLQRLAYWLIRNGQAEMDHDTALALIEEALPAMPVIAVQGSATHVLTHLLGRSGLLRTPAADTVDFVHRTFQDYLGAKAALEARDLPLLVRNAHDDQWEDVLRMAVGHARPEERAKLLRRLISRGDRANRHRTRLHLLATACLEYATELDAEVREEVRTRAAALLPPRSFEEAQSLADVGPVILDLLPGPDSSIEDDEKEMVVRTATLIGGDAAMQVHKRFRTCTEGQVPWELQNAWGRFDPETYAREVLQAVPNLPLVHVTSEDQRALLHGWHTPPMIIYQGHFRDTSMIAPLDPERLEHLSIQDNPSLENLEFLKQLPGLWRLTLLNCPAVTDLSPLTDCMISDLSLLDCNSVSLKGLGRLTGLEHLNLHMDLPAGNVDALPIRSDLKTLWLGPRTCASLTLYGITRWANITNLNIMGPTRGFEEVAELPFLKKLLLHFKNGYSLLKNLPPMPQVRELSLNHKDDCDLTLLPSRFSNLKMLRLSCFEGDRHVDLTPFRDYSDLKIQINGAIDVHGAEDLRGASVTRYPRPRS
ncbi:NACHT domain-containing protein [Streptomyces sp. WMMB 322]|uniref:NACHT domain-containing protein n=1 Tax=Streptomyces sp. WMMB 322 TaxID=1286821 RepID=UPI000823E1B8|nr:NACHT domain-containing protein [Streptomyces sp. WMMB 322]SCK09545.1 Helix-turn-helix domain-containing protein [Streptomyces sp. WMMB 322]